MVSKGGWGSLRRVLGSTRLYSRCPLLMRLALREGGEGRNYNKAPWLLVPPHCPRHGRCSWRGPVNTPGTRLAAVEHCPTYCPKPTSPRRYHCSHSRLRPITSEPAVHLYSLGCQNLMTTQSSSILFWSNERNHTNGKQLSLFSALFEEQKWCVPQSQTKSLLWESHQKEACTGE